MAAAHGSRNPRPRDLGLADAILNNSTLSALSSSLSAIPLTNFTDYLTDLLSSSSEPTSSNIRKTIDFLQPYLEQGLGSDDVDWTSYLEELLPPNRPILPSSRCSDPAYIEKMKCSFDAATAMNSSTLDANCFMSVLNSPGCLPGFMPTPGNGSDLFASTPILQIIFETTACCEGYFCRAGLRCMTECSQGSYCPSPTNTSIALDVLRNMSASDLSELPYCQVFNTTLDPIMGCGGASIDFACPTGSYCPNQTFVELCPEGYFCRTASLKPVSCPVATICPPGTENPNFSFFGAIILVLVLLIFLAVIYIYEYYSRLHWSRIEAHPNPKSDPIGAEAVNFFNQVRMAGGAVERDFSEDAVAVHREPSSVGTNLKRALTNPTVLSKVANSLFTGRRNSLQSSEPRSNRSIGGQSMKFAHLESKKEPSIFEAPVSEQLALGRYRDLFVVTSPEYEAMKMNEYPMQNMQKDTEPGGPNSSQTATPASPHAESILSTHSRSLPKSSYTDSDQSTLKARRSFDADIPAKGRLSTIPSMTESSQNDTKSPHDGHTVEPVSSASIEFELPKYLSSNATPNVLAPLVKSSGHSKKPSLVLNSPFLAPTGSPHVGSNSIIFGYPQTSDMKSPSIHTISAAQNGIEVNSAPVITFEKKQYCFKIECKDLGLKLKSKDGKTVLAGVTGTLQPGKVCAIMGPSGAGKTTFLSTLAGKAYYGDPTGEIKINGQAGSITDYRDVVGFVPQEDIMLRVLTIEENLRFNAYMRLPKSYSRFQVEEIIVRTLALLELWEVRHSIIGDENNRGISGGQRKRVNIGMELVADPTILFLDEPTSGLDSSTSQTVLRALKLLSQSGVSVITVLHQPRFEIFQLFDEVLLLAKGGRTAYLGPTGKMMEYFTSLGFKMPPFMNPADFYLDIVAGEIKSSIPKFNALEYIIEEWKVRSSSIVREQSDEFVIGDPALFVPRVKRSFFEQTWLFFTRAQTQLLRSKIILLADATLMIVIAIILGLMNMTYEYTLIVNAYNIISIVMALTMMQVGLRVFAYEKTVYFREAAAGMSGVAYFFGKELAFIPIMALLPGVFTMLFYPLFSPYISGFMFYGLCLLAVWNSASIGQFLGLIAPPHSGEFAAVICALVLNFLNGAVPTLKLMREQFGFAADIFTGSFYTKWWMQLSISTELGTWPGVLNVVRDAILKAYGYDFDSHVISLSLCLVFGFVFYSLCLIVLLFKDRQRQI